MDHKDEAKWVTVALAAGCCLVLAALIGTGAALWWLIEALRGLI